MTKTRFLTVALATTFLFTVPAAYAADPAPAGDHHMMMHEPMTWDKLPPDAQKDVDKDKWEHMKPEERHEWMVKRHHAMREKYEHMNEADKAKFDKEHPKFAEHMKERHEMKEEHKEARHEKLEKMSPAERKEAKSHMKEHREARHKEWKEHHEDAAPSAGGSQYPGPQ